MKSNIDSLNQSADAYMEAHNIKDAKSYKERVVIFWDAVRHAGSEDANKRENHARSWTAWEE